MVEDIRLEFNCFRVQSIPVDTKNRFESNARIGHFCSKSPLVWRERGYILWQSDVSFSYISIVMECGISTIILVHIQT